MKSALQGKRLLMLGSTPNIVGMVEAAQRLGVFVLVTDNKPYEDAPAKHIADEYADVSLADIDAVVELIREKRLDGVLTGFSDSYLTYYREICEKAGLPCYGDEITFGIATDKMLFKAACEKAGVGTIPGVHAYSYEELLDFAQKTGCPLMLKPADNSGSRGVIKCERMEDLRAAYDYALSFSPTKNVICERFMDCDGIGVSYQLIDGEAYLSSTCDRYNYYADGDGGSCITGDLIYPSRYTARYLQEMDEAVRRMLKQNGFRHGMVSLQSFVDDNGFYMCEMCYRPSGGHHYILINNQNGIDGMALLIEFALTGQVVGYEKEKETPYFEQLCSMTHMVGVPRTAIAKAEGFEKVRVLDNVIDVSQALFAGDVTGKDGTTAQVLGSVWFCGKDRQALEDTVQKIRATLCCEDSNGQTVIKERPFAPEK